jgi:glycosyltransferase 2 family protein
MKERIALIVSGIIGFILFCYILVNIGVKNIIYSFANLKPIYFLPYLIISFLIFFTLTFKWQLILFAFKKYVPLKKLLCYKSSAFAISFLTPSAFFGGDSIRAYFLSKHNISYKKGFSSTILDKSIEITINLIFTIIGSFFFILNFALPRNTILVIILGLTFACFILFLFYYRLMKNKTFFSVIVRFGKLFHKDFFSKIELEFREIEKSISYFFKNHKTVFFLALFLSFLAWIFTFLEFQMLFMAFGYKANFTILFLMIAITGLAYIIPVPAALGVLEGGYTSLFRYSNMLVEKAFAFGTIVRFRDLLISFFGIFYLFNFGLFKKNKDFKKDWKI